MPNGKLHMTACKLLKHFKLALLVALLLSPAVSAQGAGKVIGAVVSSDQQRYREAHQAVLKVLANRGFNPDNVEVILQNPNPDPISWANSIRKFNAINADLIVTYGAPVTFAAARDVTEIPIVFADVYGPVENGISRSMTTTGRNLTGVSSKVPMATLLAAYLGIRSIKNIGVIYSSREIGSVVQLKEIKRIAAQYGFNVTEANVSSPAGLDTALTSLLSQVDCVYISESFVGSRKFEKIIRQATESRIPVLSHMPYAAEKGALVSLEVNPAEQGQMAGEYAAKILGGKNPSRMPVLSPKKIDLFINLRAAKILDLRVPFQTLGQATKILK